ncbi:hypothetical protein [Burkholderia ubonensis]|uniref:Uncharacterized protein n=1 Tax=Burkholderia ubonensis TaxID=101571 RepID=A0A1R1JCV0_9BURK|nr:hypothetical protein [Burkholderia ubonensis]OMG73122.1 hypothetical protein BW685_12940 [Burkholderia ubonensis]
MIDGELTQDAGGGFAALDGMAAGVDAEAAAALNPGAAVPPGQPAPGPDYARGAAGMVDLISSMLDGYAPGAGWSEQQRALMAASIAPVLEKYGWDIEGSMPCELMALAVCGPALYQSAKVVALKIQADRIALARAARGLDDPNTVRGGQQPATSAADALRQAASEIPNFPGI